MENRPAPPPCSPGMRREIAQAFLGGQGLEIGALHAPFPLPPGAAARYVDRFDVDGLRKQYPELASQPLVPVDIVDDGEELRTVPDSSVDFVVASHFLEHCENPLGAIRSFLRVVRPGGSVLMAVPDMTTTFDKDRGVTSIAHLVQDDREGPAVSRRAHYEDWCLRVKGLQDAAAVAERTERYLVNRYSIHFHTWTAEAFQEFMWWLRSTWPGAFDMAAYVHHRPNPKFCEMITVLRRRVRDERPA